MRIIASLLRVAAGLAAHLAVGVACLCLVASAQASSEAAPGTAEAAAPASATQPTVTTEYVHKWIAMPSFSAQALPLDGETKTIAPARGRALVIVFLASWCEPCQQLTPLIRKLQERYTRLHTDFVYLFAHDTPEDAVGFMQEFKLAPGVLASYDALKAYNNPELPTIYVGDRRGWLTSRYINASEADLASLDKLLRYLTSY